MIKFRCGACEQKIGVEDAHAGRRACCPRCGKTVAVPRPGATEAVPAREQKRRELVSILQELDRPVAPTSPVEPGPAQSSPAAVVQDRTLPSPYRLPVPELAGLAVLILVSLAALILGSLTTQCFFAFVAFAVAYGYLLGASKVAATLGGMLVAALLAMPMGKGFEGLTRVLFGTTGLTNRMFSTAVWAVVNLIVVGLVLQILIGRAVKKNPQRVRYDRRIGSGLGLLEGILLGFLMIWAVLAMEPMANTSLAQSGNDTPPNPVAQFIVNAADKIRASAVGRAAAAVNPLEDMRLIKIFQDGLIVLNEPVARDAFLTHPAMQALKDRDSVKQAMEIFNGDAHISRVVEGHGGIKGGDLRAILDSDALLRVIDDTDVLDDLSPIADDVERAIIEARQEAVARVNTTGEQPP